MDAADTIQAPSHGLGVHSKSAQVEVIVVPFPCHSHLNQLLHLSCLIAAHKIPVHYAATAIHLRQAKLRFVPQSCFQNSNIHFHELPTSHFLSPPPNPNSSSKFPSHLQPSFDASLHLRQPTAVLLREIAATARRVVVIHDLFMAYVVQDVVTLPNAESYVFSPVSAFHYSFRVMKGQNSVQLQLQEMKGIPSIDACSIPEFQSFVALQLDFLSLAAGVIFNSCRSIEGTFIDKLAKAMNSENKQIWAVGPLNHASESDRRESKGQHKCLEWLDKQVPKSVQYVSFGTTTTMADEQIKELAIGLEQSKQKFIWILRDADKGDIFAGDEKRAQLPDGYEERVKEFGLVMRDWVPQVEILGHPSTGGFMSHCGWNSFLESITMGVPTAAWPMHSDQPRNAFLVTDMLKVGVVVNAWEKREEIVNSTTIARAVKSLMASKEGEETRKRVEEIGGAARLAVKEGGISLLELDSFIAHINKE